MKRLIIGFLLTVLPSVVLAIPDGCPTPAVVNVPGSDSDSGGDSGGGIGGGGGLDPFSVTTVETLTGTVQLSDGAHEYAAEFGPAYAHPDFSGTDFVAIYTESGCLIGDISDGHTVDVNFYDDSGSRWLLHVGSHDLDANQLDHSASSGTVSYREEYGVDGTLNKSTNFSVSLIDGELVSASYSIDDETQYESTDLEDAIGRFHDDRQQLTELDPPEVVAALIEDTGLLDMSERRDSQAGPGEGADDPCCGHQDPLSQFGVVVLDDGGEGPDYSVPDWLVPIAVTSGAGTGAGAAVFSFTSVGASKGGGYGAAAGFGAGVAWVIYVKIDHALGDDEEADDGDKDEE